MNLFNGVVNVSQIFFEGSETHSGSSGNKESPDKPTTEEMTSKIASTNPSSVTNKEDITQDFAQGDETKVYFKLDMRPQIVDLPDTDDLTTINVKYDLIPPHVKAHVFWDSKNNELMYYIEEPELDDIEREILRLVKLGLEEMINISFINAAKNKKVLEYLEKNVQSILSELGTMVSMESYQKIMYFIYRDFIGIDEIEPLLRDYYIEDIECNGTNSPVYIVHRKFRNLRTNLVFKEEERLTSFVEKLSQKCGRYISYAQPLLDGTLPDGSRVNATYSPDVTTRGPTFTIRKFTKDPWMPTTLIKFKTASAAFFAYIWLAVEHKFNIISIGETGSGKTTLLNAVASFVPDEARICSIEDTRELNLAHENWLPAVTREGFGVANLTGEKYGEVTLFDLLNESFRQNPDYVIVGEVRGKETYVLFQGMASGHSCISTFHAASVETLVKRLETPPISLPASLVESLNVICVMTHLKDQDKNYRRIKEIDEIISVKQNGSGVDYNAAFKYDPLNDKINANENFYTLNLINKLTGISIEDLKTEIQIRTELLNKMVEKGVADFRDFSSLINEYYSNPRLVLDKYDIKTKSLQELRSEKQSVKKEESEKIAEAK